MKISEIDQEFKTLYVHRPVIGPKEFFNWINANIETEIPNDEFHITIAYSTTPVDWKSIPEKTDFLIIEADPNRKLTVFGQATVLLVNSDELHNRWKEFIEHGASYDFKEYHPHVTLSYKDPVINKIYNGPIQLGPEKFDIVKEG